MKLRIKKFVISLSIFVFSISAFSLDQGPKKWNFSLAEPPEISIDIFCFENSSDISVYYEEGESKRREVPPLEIERIFGEILVGAALGAGGGCSLGFLCTISGGMWGCIVPIFVSALIGSSLGIYLIGSIGNQTGSYWATLGGSVLGMVGGLLLNDDSIYVSWVGIVVGGVIGFNLTRRYKSSACSGKSLINFKDGKMSLGFIFG